MLNKDILIHLYNGLTRYDHVLIGKIRQTCKMFSYYPKSVLSVEYERGRTFYKLLVGDKAILHRDNNAAVEYVNGSREWWVRGKRHREGGPAVECAHKEWFLHGILRREYGPAVECVHKEWFVHGERHREDGPAVEWVNGDKEWFVHGKRHREDGPAAEWTDRGREWWIRGEEYSESDFEIAREQLKY